MGTNLSSVLVWHARMSGVRIAMACAHVCLHIISKIQSDGSRLVLFCKSDEADTLAFFMLVVSC